MPAAGAADDHGVDILVVQHLVIVPAGLRVKARDFQCLLAVKGVNVADRDQLDGRDRLEQLHQVLRPAAGAEDAHPDPVIRAQHARGSQAAQHRGARTRNRGALQKLPSRNIVLLFRRKTTSDRTGDRCVPVQEPMI